MTDTERIKMALPLLQALADGKQLQFRMPNDEWRAMELDCDAVLEQPTSYRIAPAIPPRPTERRNKVSTRSLIALAMVCATILAIVYMRTPQRGMTRVTTVTIKEPQPVLELSTPKTTTTVTVDLPKATP